MILLLLACVGEPEVVEDTGCEVTWAGWSFGFFADYCLACHSVNTVDRQGAPEGVDFDTRQQALDHADRVRARVIEDETMPVGGGVYADDLELLERWLDCPG